MDFTNLKFCRSNDKRRNMPPYRFLSTGNVKPPEFPCVRLTGHQPEVKPAPVFPGDFFQARSVIISGFVTSDKSPQSNRDACQTIVDLSQNILDSFSKTQFPGLKIASYILANGTVNKPQVSTASTSLPESTPTLISDHTASSFCDPVRRTYANIVQTAPKQSYAEVTKMAVCSKPASENRPRESAVRNRRPKRGNYFHRERRSVDNTNWRDRSTEVRDFRREERKPRYVVERHPKYDASCRSEHCNNWRCRKHDQKTCAKQETMRRAKEERREEKVEVEERKMAVIPQVEQKKEKVETGSCAGGWISLLSPGNACSLLLSSLTLQERQESPEQREESPEWESDSDEEEDEEDEEEDRLREVNDRWRSENPGPVVERRQDQLKVRFQLPAVVHHMITWSHAAQAARCGPWEQAARDRARFQLRVARTEPCLAQVFDAGCRERARRRQMVSL